MKVCSWLLLQSVTTQAAGSILSSGTVFLSVTMSEICVICTNYTVSIVWNSFASVNEKAIWCVFIADSPFVLRTSVC